jgi:mannosyltransferase
MDKSCMKEKNHFGGMKFLTFFQQGNLMVSNSLRKSLVESIHGKILIVLTVIGLTLRLYHISVISLWLDEALTNYYAHLSFLDILKITLMEDNPPLFYWIEHVMLLFGNSEFILRFVPVIIGTMTIPVFYFLGREFYNRDVGIIAATLLTVSSFHIQYSQEARSFTLLLFIFSVALYYYLKALRTNSLESWLIFGFFSALACWTHYYAFVMVLPLYLFVLISRVIIWKNEIRNLKPAILATILFMILASPMLIGTIYSGSRKTAHSPTWGYQGINLIIDTMRVSFGTFEIVVFISAILFILGLIQIFRTDIDKFTFFVMAIAIPLSISYTLSFGMPMVSRYLICLLPFFFIGISCAFITFQHFTKKVNFIPIVVLILMITSIPSLQVYYSSNSKSGEDWKNASLNLRNLSSQGDVIVFVPGFYSIPFNYYYNNQSEKTYEFMANNQSELDTIISANKGRTVFLVIVNPDFFDSSRESIGWIKEHSHLKYQDGAITIYSTG